MKLIQEHAAGKDAPSSGDVGQAATVLDRPLATQPTPSYDGASAPGGPANQGRWTRHTVPSDVVMPAYFGSRLDTADAVAAMTGMYDAVAASQDCSDLLAHRFAANQVPAPRGATGWDVPTLKTVYSTKTATRTTESRSRVPRAIRLADQACQYCRRLGDGSR
jgi:hypothetical protein